MEEILNLDNIDFIPDGIREYFFNVGDDFRNFSNKIDKKLDYFYVTTKKDVSIIEEMEKSTVFFFNLLLECFGNENKYLCSYKYFFLKNKLYKYNSKILISSEKSTIVLNTDNYVVKYATKNKKLGISNNFFEDAKKEKEVLEKLADKNYEFVEKQRLVSFEITDNYIIIVKKKINGEIFKKKSVAKFMLKDKIDIIRQLLEQLVILDKEGYLYDDLRAANFMFDNENGRVHLIDLGSVKRKIDYNNVKYINISRRSTFNILDAVLIIVYNLFNLRDDFFLSNRYACDRKNKLYCMNNYELTARNLVANMLNKDQTFTDFYDYINTLSVRNNKIVYGNGDIIINNNLKKMLKNEDCISIEYVEKIKNLFPREINSVVDLQCGSYLSLKKEKIWEENNLKYIGVNIDNNLILENRQRMRFAGRAVFMTLDPVNEPIPEVDLIACGNIAKYLSMEQIWMLFENIKSSGAKYFAINYQYKKNQKLIEEPFYLPLPLCFIPANETTIIALYKISDVEFFLNQCLDAKLRLELVKYFDNDLKRIFAAFNKHDNGNKLFMDVMKDNKVDYEKYYHAPDYAKIVDGEGIFTPYINMLIVKGGANNKEIERIQKETSYGKLVTKENRSFVKTILIDYIDFKFNVKNTVTVVADVSSSSADNLVDKR